MTPPNWGFEKNGVLLDRVVSPMPTLKPGKLGFYIGVYSPKRVDPCLKTPPPFFAR